MQKWTFLHTNSVKDRDQLEIRSKQNAAKQKTDRVKLLLSPTQERRGR